MKCSNFVSRTVAVASLVAGLSLASLPSLAQESPLTTDPAIDTTEDVEVEDDDVNWGWLGLLGLTGLLGLRKKHDVVEYNRTPSTVNPTDPTRAPYQDR